MSAIKIGICATGAQLALLGASGADYIEEHAQQFLVPRLDQSEFEARLKSLPGRPPLYSANCFLPGEIKVVGPAADFGKLFSYAATAFARARQAGIKVIVFGSSGSRAVPEGFEKERAKGQFVDALKGLAPLAGDAGLTLVVEPLNRLECNFINTLDEGAELVAACGQPAVRLLADIYHMLMDGEAAVALIRNGALLSHAHIAEKQGRAFPGKHGEDFGPYLRALKEIEYQGALSLECGWSDLAKEAPGAIVNLHQQLKSAGLE
jgi:sugar phosphate isomerase/epimerase